MLKKNLDSVSSFEDGKGAGLSWTAPLRSLLSALTIIFLLSVTLAAQVASSTAGGAPQGTVYGSGYQVPLEFAGEPAPVNQVSLGVGVASLFDDNALATNGDRVSDEALSFTAHFAVERRTKRLALSFSYNPFLIFYRQLTAYDLINHAGNLRLTYRVGSHFLVGVQDTASYQNGMYPTLTAQPVLSGPPSPIGQNGIIVPYTVRTLTDTTGLYLTFLKSRRTSVTLTGGYTQSKYGAASQNPDLKLYNGTGFSGGLTLQHFVTSHTSFGFLLLHQDTSYQGGLSQGSQVRTQIESAYLSLASLLSPSTTITLFGGPQYVRSLNPIVPVATLSAHFQSSGGGSVTKQLRRTAFDLSFIRSVTDGGGLYTSVVTNRALFGARRRLVGRWGGDIQVGAAREDASLFQSGNGRIEGVIAGGLDQPAPIVTGFNAPRLLRHNASVEQRFAAVEPQF